VAFEGVVGDPRLEELIYSPGHPDADKNGYIRASNCQSSDRHGRCNERFKSYEANLALITITKTMAPKATESENRETGRKINV
jgi:flagellar basal-body rod protein FlgC